MLEIEASDVYTNLSESGGGLVCTFAEEEHYNLHESFYRVGGGIILPSHMHSHSFSTAHGVVLLNSITARISFNSDHPEGHEQSTYKKLCSGPRVPPLVSLEG